LAIGSPEARDLTPSNATAQVALELPCRPDSPAVARREMDRLEGELGHGAVTRVRVIVNEMVSNCVLNASGDSMLVEVAASPSVVRGEVIELDVEHDSRPPEPVTFRRGGFGLLLVRRLADRFGTLQERPGMWFEIDCPTDG
jgi:two-component sensor histidine kinase